MDYKKYEQNPVVVWLYHKKDGLQRRVNCTSICKGEDGFEVNFTDKGRRFTEHFDYDEWALRNDVPISERRFKKKRRARRKTPVSVAPAETPAPQPVPVGPRRPPVENPGNLQKEQPGEYIARLHTEGMDQFFRDPVKMAEVKHEAEKNYAIQEADRKIKQARARAVFAAVNNGALPVGATPDTGGSD